MSTNLALLLLQASGGAGLLFNLLPLAMIFLLFYFLIVLPQRKRQQQTQLMLDNLKPGDKVATSGGLIGTITIVRDDKRTVQLRIAENPSVRVDVLRSSIAGLHDTPEEKK